MKKSRIIITTFAFILATAGALILKASPSSRTMFATYYDPTNNCTAIDCVTTKTISCAGFYDNQTNCQAHNGTGVLPVGTALKHN